VIYPSDAVQRLEVGTLAPTVGPKRLLRPSARGTNSPQTSTGGLVPVCNTVPHRSGIEAKGSLYTPSSFHPSRRLLRTKP